MKSCDKRGNFIRGVTKGGGGKGRQILGGGKFGEKRKKKKDFTKKCASNQLFCSICQNIFAPVARYIFYFNIISVSKYLGGAKFGLAPGAIYPSYATELHMLTSFRISVLPCA